MNVLVWDKKRSSFIVLIRIRIVLSQLLTFKRHAFVRFITIISSVFKSKHHPSYRASSSLTAMCVNVWCQNIFREQWQQRFDNAISNTLAKQDLLHRVPLQTSAYLYMSYACICDDSHSRRASLIRSIYAYTEPNRWIHDCTHARSTVQYCCARSSAGMHVYVYV